MGLQIIPSLALLSLHTCGSSSTVKNHHSWISLHTSSQPGANLGRGRKQLILQEPDTFGGTAVPLQLFFPSAYTASSLMERRVEIMHRQHLSFSPFFLSRLDGGGSAPRAKACKGRGGISRPSLAATGSASSPLRRPAEAVVAKTRRRIEREKNRRTSTDKKREGERGNNLFSCHLHCASFLLPFPYPLSVPKEGRGAPSPFLFPRPPSSSSSPPIPGAQKVVEAKESGRERSQGLIYLREKKGLQRSQQ